MAHSCQLPSLLLCLPKTSSPVSVSTSLGANRSYYIPISSPTATEIAYPSLSFSTTLYFKSAYNVQVTVSDDEPEDKLINRFKREVLRAGVLQECRRRRFFENKHDKIKRKAREASRRNRKRKPQPRTPEQNKHDFPKKEKDDDEYDNWELPDVDLPYC